MTTEELCANLTKACEIIHEAGETLWTIMANLPGDLEINIIRLPVAAETTRDVTETLEFMRGYLFTDENDARPQLSDKEIKKICAIICSHLWLVHALLEDIQYDPAIADSDYGTDLLVLSTAIAEMIGKFQQKGDGKEQTE